MDLPRISIVTPSYNQGRYIEWTIRSVLLQRYPKLEYVVMDGGSKDETTDILEKYDAHLHYWQSAPDRGQSDAIDRGVTHTSGDIMAYLNSDDMLAPHTLQWVAQYFQTHPHVDVVYSHRCAVDAMNRVIWYWILPPHSNYLMKRWDLIPQETCFWRRSIYDKVGGIDPSFQFAMDYDLFVRFMAEGKMVRANRFLGAFRQHAAAKTSTNLADVGTQEIKRVWSKYGIRSFSWDPLVGPAFSRWVELRSYMFTETHACLHGHYPGIGYNYSDVWGGLLDERQIPPREAAPPSVKELRVVYE